MKLIRNRKMLQAKRRRYSHLMQSFRATIKEGAQEMSKRDAMIEWLAQACEELALELCDYPKFQCPKEKQDWINDAEKAVQDADGK
jgi:hypothetical protein